MADKRVLFLAFANSDTAPLARLREEDEAIYQLLHQRGVKEGHFHLHRDSQTNLDNLRHYLSDFRDQVFIFHYAGHANSAEIFLQSGEAQAGGIAEMLAEQNQLKLVFLNGCSTRGQVQALLDLGIPAVIATRAPIEDTLATRFAKHFYHALALGATIGEAYQEAAAYAKAAGKALASIEDLDRSLGSRMDGKKAGHDDLWGLFHAEDRAEILNEKLPSHQQSTVSPDYKPNESLINALWYGLTEGENAPLDYRRKDPKLKVKRKLILSEFPAPVAEHLRKLMVPLGEEGQGYDKVSPARLGQLAITYNVLMELLTYTLLAQLWEMEIKYRLAEIKAPGSGTAPQLPPNVQEMIRAFLYLPEADRQTYRFIPLIREIQKVLDAHQEAYFVEELTDLAELIEDNSEFRGACLLLDLLRERLAKSQVAEGEVAELCIQAEQALSQIFQALGYLARYTLATIKSIDVEKYRHTLQAEFRHIVVRLKDLLGGMEEEDATLLRFMDNRSVLLLKEDEDEDEIEGFLNLSPFMMDENAFVPDSDLAKIYFLHHYRAEEQVWYYRYVNKPRDPLLRVPGELFKLIEEQLKAFAEAFLDQ